ncbi:MAG: CPBP family intramembrane glutamic endopeptidase [Acidimicrobiales bacterium]
MNRRSDDADLAAIVTLLVVVALANAFLFEGVIAPLAQLICAAAAVVAARRRDYTWEELGLARGTVPAGLRLGGLTALVAVAGVGIVALVPTTRNLLEDDRFLDLSAAEAVYEIAIRIPLVTALTEEVLFRSVLLAVLVVRWSSKPAVVVSSLLFGLWHVFTALGDLGQNGATEDFAGWDVIIAVVGIVVATGIAGIAFAWLRLRSGSVAAPWVVHSLLNASTFGVGVALAT